MVQRPQGRDTTGNAFKKSGILKETPAKVGFVDLRDKFRIKREVKAVGLTGMRNKKSVAVEEDR